MAHKTGILTMSTMVSNSVSFISTHLRTTLESITSDVGVLTQTFADELISAGIVPTGPMMFLYDGVDGNPKTKFDLRIALPVSQADAARYDGKHNVDRLQPFTFIETVLYGDIAQLGPKAYEPLMIKMQKAGLQPTGFVREVYQNFVDLSSEDNETRVQIGV